MACNIYQVDNKLMFRARLEPGGNADVYTFTHTEDNTWNFGSEKITLYKIQTTKKNKEPKSFDEKTTKHLESIKNTKMCVVSSDFSLVCKIYDIFECCVGVKTDFGQRFKLTFIGNNEWELSVSSMLFRSHHIIMLGLKDV